jgi:hypothetical protein
MTYTLRTHFHTDFVFEELQLMFFHQCFESQTELYGLITHILNISCV